MEHFSSADIMLIEKEIGRKTYADIAFLIDKPVAQLREFLATWLQGKNIVTWQSVIDGREKVQRAPKAKVKPEKEAPMVISRRIESEQKEKRDRKSRAQFKTKEVDLGAMTQVRIDAKTWIYIKPGQDPEKEKKKYLQRLQENNSRTATNAA